MVRQSKYRKAFTAMLDGLYPKGGIKKQFFKLMMWLMAKAPSEPSDLLITIDAEDKHVFKDLLSKINVPTLVIGGEDDYFYPIYETAQGIPNAELKLYKGFGHNAWLDNRQKYREDIVAFLETDL
jgi:pimeloyl-ACP methyl ester carboxylesterase